MIDMKKLFAPYATPGRGHTLEETLGWIHKEGVGLNIRPEVVEAAIREVFLEMEAGKKFPTDIPVSEPGGFGPRYPHAALNLYLKEKMIVLNQKFMENYTEVLQKSLNDSIKQHNIRKRPRLFNWSKSPVARRLKRGA